MTIAQRIKRRRLECGLSRDALARACAVHRNTIENWESGRTRPVLRNIYPLAGVLSVTPTWLRLGGPAPGEPRKIQPVLISDTTFAGFLDAQIWDLERRLSAARAARWRLTA